LFALVDIDTLSGINIVRQVADRRAGLALPAAPPLRLRRKLIRLAARATFPLKKGRLSG